MNTSSGFTAMFVCLGFAALFPLIYLARHLIEEWSEAILPSFNSGFANFFIRIAMWFALALLIFGGYHLCTYVAG